MSTELDLSPYDDFLKQFSGPRPASTAPQAQPQENSWATPVRPWQPPKVEQQQVNTPQVQTDQAEPDISPYGDFLKQFSDAPEPMLQTPEKSSWGAFAARNTMTLYGGLVNNLAEQVTRAGKVATNVAKPALDAIANSMSMFSGEDEGRADNSSLVKESINKTFDPAMNFFSRNQDTIEQVAQDKFPADPIESMPLIDKDKSGKTVYNTQLLNPFSDVGRHWLSRNVAQAGMSMAPTLVLAYAGMPGVGLGLGGAMEGQSVARDAAKDGDSDAAILGKYLAMAGYVAASEKLPLDEMTKPLRNSTLWQRLKQVGLTSLIEGTQEYSEELVQNIISNADKVARGDKSFADALREFADAARQGVNVIPGAAITGGGVSTVNHGAAVLRDRAEKANTVGTSPNHVLPQRDPIAASPEQENEVFNSLWDSVQAAQQERDGKQPPAGPAPVPRTDAEAQDASATVGEMVRGGTSPVDANVDQLEYELRKSGNWREMPDEDPPKVIARVAQEAGPYWRIYLDAAGGNQTLASRMYLEDVTNQGQAAQQEPSEAQPVAQATPQTDVAEAGQSDPRSLVATNQADAVPPTAQQADANQEPSAQQAVVPDPTASVQPVAQEPQKRTLKRAESPTMDDAANGTQTPKRTLKRPEMPTVAFRGDTSTDDAIDIGEGEPVAPEQIAARIDDLDASIRTSAKIDQHTGRNSTSQRVALEDTRKRLELAFDDWKAAHPVGWQAYQQRQSGTANAKAGDTVQVPGRGTGTVVRANKRNLTVQFDGKRPELVNRAGIIVQPAAQESEAATVKDSLQVPQAPTASVNDSLTVQDMQAQGTSATNSESLYVGEPATSRAKDQTSGERPATPVELPVTPKARAEAEAAGVNPNETRKGTSEQDVSREHGQNEADPQAARRETARVTEAGEQKADEGVGATASRAGNGGGVSAQLDQLDDSAAYGDDEAASDEGDRMELPERETKDPAEHEVWLTLYAAGRPMSSDEIASKAMDPESMGTMNRKRVDKALERMVASGFLEERDGKYWAAQKQENTSRKPAPTAAGKNGKKASAVERAQAAAPNALETRTVQDESELPEHVRSAAKKSLDRMAKVRAVYDPKTNTVWLVLGRLKDSADAITAWVHEQVGHAGMRAIMTAKEHARMLKSVVTTVGRDNLRAMFPAYTGLTDSQLADEYIAKLSEDMEREGRLGGKQRTVWEKILGYVRRAMNALGLRQSLTKTAARDIQETVRRAAEYVRGQSAGTGTAESGSETMFSAEEQDNPFAPVDVYAGLPWSMARDMANDTADAFDSAIMGDSGTDALQDKLTGQPESSQYRIIRSWEAKNPASTAILGKILKEDAEHAQYGSHTFYLPAEDVSTNKVKSRGPIVVRDSKPDGARVRPVLIHMGYTNTVDMAGRDLSDAQISDAVKENDGEFSTLLFTNVGSAKENVGVVFSPEHVKSGEVITADKDGQIIEDRFQEDDSDIRFSATQDAEPEVKARKLIDRLRAVVPNASARQKAVFTGVVSAAIAEGVREGRDMRVGKDAQEIFKIVLRNMKDTYNRDSDLPKLAGILGEWRKLLNNISVDSNVEDPFERSRIIRNMMQDYFGDTFDRVFAASDASPDALLREMEIAWGKAVSHYYGRALARLILYNPRDLWNDTENPLREKWLAISQKYKAVVDLKKQIAKMSAFIRKERDAGSTPAVIESFATQRQIYRDALEKKLQELPPKEIESTFLALQELREKSKSLQQALQFDHDVERAIVAEDIESTVYQSTDAFASKGAIRKFISYVGKALDGLQNIAEVIGAFDHKSKAYEFLWTRFRASEDKSNKLYSDTMQKLRDKLASLGVSGMKLAEWANDTITADFGKIKKSMTTMELMTLYAYTKDPDAYEKLLRNGMVVKRDKGMGYSWKVDAKAIDRALEALTDEQRDIVDTMMVALKGAARHADNASMRMFGHEMFYAPLHWHIEVDRSQSDLVLNVDDVGQMNDMQLLQNMGLAKERVEHRHPLVLGNVMSTFAMEARYLSNFSHLAETTLDAIRIIGKSNVGIALRRQFGNGYYKHVTKAIVDAGRSNRHVEGKSTLKRILTEIESGIAVNAVGFRATSYLKNLLSGSIPAFTEAYRINPKAAALFAKLHATSAGEVLDKRRRQRYLDAREKLSKNGFLQARWADGFTATFSSVPRTTEELSSMVKELLPAKVQNLSVPVAKALHVKRVVSEKSMSWMRNAEQRIGANLYLAFRDSGMSEEDALSSVEEVIRNTQNPSSRIDEGGVYTAWKSSELSMFGMFLGQPMTQANLLRRDLYRALYFKQRGTKQEADAAAHQVYRTALGLAASTVVSVGINALFAISAKGTFGAIWNALTGQGDDDDKKKVHIQAVRSLSQMFGEALDDFIPGTGRFVDAPAKALDSLITSYKDDSLDGKKFVDALSGLVADVFDAITGENALQGVRYDSMFLTDLMKDSTGERLGGVARAMKFAGSVGVPVSGPMQLIGAASGAAGYPLGQEWEERRPAGRRTLRSGTPRTLRQGRRRTLKSTGPVRRLRNQ